MAVMTRSAIAKDTAKTLAQILDIKATCKMLAMSTVGTAPHQVIEFVYMP